MATHGPDLELLKQGMATGIAACRIMNHNAVELCRRWRPDDADHALFLVSLFELSTFLLSIIGRQARGLLGEDAGGHFSDAVADGFVRELQKIDEPTFQDERFVDRYYALLDDRTAVYGKFPDVGSYDAYGLYQFVLEPTPVRTDLFRAFARHLTGSTKLELNGTIALLLKNQVEEAMDELKLNQVLPSLAKQVVGGRL